MEKTCFRKNHSLYFGKRECKRLVFAKTTPWLLGSGSVKGLFLQKTLLSFGEVGVETAKNCKTHSHAFLKREWDPKKIQKALSQERKKGVHFLETDNFHSRKPKLRECKRRKIRKYAPVLQKPESVKPTKSRNTLPVTRIQGVEKSKKQEKRSQPSKPRECKSQKS